MVKYLKGPYINNIKAKMNGFSFVELMIAMAILCIILLIAFGVMITQRKAFKAESEVMDMSQNTRASLDILLRDLRMSGYKALEEQFLHSLSGWISTEYLPSSPKSVSLSEDDCPIITEGDGTDPDMITLFIADTRENNLLNSVNNGDTVIVLDPNSQGFTDSTKFKVNDIIRIGDQTEFAKIVGVSGNSLTIDIDPYTGGNQGFAENHPSGETIREINVITYSVFNEANDSSYQHHTAGHPVLKRKHNEKDYEDIAEDVEDLQIIPHAPPRYRLKLITRTSAQGDYVEGSSDGYKRTELLADFRIRNFIKPQCLVPETPTVTSLTGLNSSFPCTIQVSWEEVTKDVDGEVLSTECAISDYIVTYANTPETRFYTAYPGTDTSCDLDISAILRDPNHLTYYISVVAVNSSGISEYSTELTISDSSPPSAVSDLTASAEGHAINISWTGNPECDVAEYRLYRSTNPGGPFDSNSLLTNDFILEHGFTKTYTYQDKNLPCNTYYYVVRSFDHTYESGDSNIAQETISDSAPPAGPPNFSFTLMDTSVIFNWTLSIDDPFRKGEGDDDVINYHLYALSGESEFLLNDSIPAGQRSITLESQGYSNFGIKAMDLCDNISNLVTQPINCQGAVNVSIDNPVSEETLADVATISGTAYSVNSLVQVELKIDNDDWIGVEGTDNWTYSWDTTTVSNGNHILVIRAEDSEGCYGITSMSVEVQNVDESDDTEPPSFGDILQDPEGEFIDADCSVWVCVEVTDYSGIYSVLMDTGFEEVMMSVNDPNQGALYCGIIPAHNGSTVSYTITAKDNSVNQNQAIISSGYTQSDAL